MQENTAIHLEDHPNYQRILDYYHVRDVVVHSGGDLSLLSKTKLREVTTVLKRSNGLSIQSNYGRIKITNVYLDRLMDDIAQFWKALEKAFIQNATVGPQYWP